MNLLKVAAERSILLSSWYLAVPDVYNRVSWMCYGKTLHRIFGLSHRLKPLIRALGDGAGNTHNIDHASRPDRPGNRIILGS